MSDAEWRKPFLDEMGCGEPIYRVQAAHCDRDPFVCEIRGFLTGSIRLNKIYTQKTTYDLLDVT